MLLTINRTYRSLRTNWKAQSASFGGSFSFDRDFNVALQTSHDGLQIVSGSCGDGSAFRVEMRAGGPSMPVASTDTHSPTLRTKPGVSPIRLVRNVLMVSTMQATAGEGSRVRASPPEPAQHPAPPPLPTAAAATWRAAPIATATLAGTAKMAWRRRSGSRAGRPTGWNTAPAGSWRHVSWKTVAALQRQRATTTTTPANLRACYARGCPRCIGHRICLRRSASAPRPARRQRQQRPLHARQHGQCDPPGNARPPRRTCHRGATHLRCPQPFEERAARRSGSWYQLCV